MNVVICNIVCYGNTEINVDSFQMNACDMCDDKMKKYSITCTKYFFLVIIFLNLWQNSDIYVFVYTGSQYFALAQFEFCSF